MSFGIIILFIGLFTIVVGLSDSGESGNKTASIGLLVVVVGLVLMALL